MFRQFLKGIIGFEPDTLADIGKKLALPSAAVGIAVANILNQLLDPLVIMSIVFVFVALVLDVVTGLIYHVYIKEPPDTFNKKKIFVSIFQFSLLVGLIVLMLFLKIALLMAEQTSIAWVVPTLEGGVTGLFVMLILIVGLVLVYDFAKRGKEMGMPGAATLMLWLRGLINKASKTTPDE